jgi:hypothetical protein
MHQQVQFFLDLDVVFMMYYKISIIYESNETNLLL